jgi:gliding motility-associated-like protein
MKKSFALIITFLYFIQVSASHISGGELFYEYLGPGPSGNTGMYKVTIRLFSDCRPIDPEHSQKIEDEIIVIGIYNNGDSSLQTSLPLTLEGPITSIASNTASIPCLTSAPDVCFKVGVFTGITELPITIGGYTLTWIRCCRPKNLANLGISSGAGGTYVTTIPGTSLLPTGVNSSPQFAIKDTALVCQGRDFTIDFGASDPNGDSISYSFCEAYSGGSEYDPDPGAPGGGGIPQKLALSPLPYKAPYSGANPLGQSVSINPVSGKITGIAPGQGRYVINVCATEWRSGKPINVHRKDFILEVGNCDFAAAEPLPVTGVWCKDFAVTFSNNNSSSAIQSYHWDFGVANATSEEATPVFTYPDTGVYTIKLTVHGARGCVDEATTTIGVYPGLKPDFSFIGSCFMTPFTFKDQSTTAYGVINSWKWDFDDAVPSDVSNIQNPTYKYSDTGTRNIKLIVTNSKGCIDSISKQAEVKRVAALSLPFKDTLICSIDTLALKAVGTGTFAWSPAYNIINPGTSEPFVFPKQTTTYVVSVKDEGGCENTDSLRINVLDSITVDAGADTSICRSDTLTLKAVSQGLQYSWTPSGSLITSPAAKNPVARPDTTTTYFVIANLGKCVAKDTVKVKVAPYPVALAGQDAVICYGNSAQLSGNITGASFAWSPQNSLSNSNTLTPVATPTITTSYVLTVHDTLGCPKPGYDTVVVNVIPPVRAFAGNDTVVIAGQPLQLNATGGRTYTWSPATGMNDPLIPDPIVTLSASYDSVTYKVRVGDGGCFSEDELKVKVFKTGPDIFIPTAFTPNADGKNDILKPIPVGIKSFDYFRVYNRWGQMLFSTSSLGAGWDGTFEGKEQATGTYVFMAKATDYMGHVISKKGTIVLIR